MWSLLNAVVGHSQHNVISCRGRVRAVLLPRAPLAARASVHAQRFGSRRRPVLSTLPTHAYSASAHTLEPETTLPRDDAARDLDKVSRKRRPSTFATYLSLTKPRLSSFVVLSAAAGFAMAPVTFSVPDMCLAMLGTSLTIASANAGNQWLEVEHDGKMQRTRLRALPRGLLQPYQAATFSVLCGVSGTALLYACFDPLTAALAGGNILLYVFGYTPLKRMHWSNTWVGAVVGAIPPVIGWTAATGGVVGNGALALAAVLYAWQIPHFLSLSWTIRREYERGGYKMLSKQLAHKVAPVTFLWALYQVPLGLLCVSAGLTDAWFALTSIVPGVPLVLAARRFVEHQTNNNSRGVFKWTLAWLPAFLLLLLLHKKEWRGITLARGQTIRNERDITATIASSSASAAPRQ